MSFRDNLLHLRAANNMTQEQLAMLLGVSRQSVTKWEAEKSYPEMDKLIKMCQIFDCTLDELVQGDLTGRTPSPSAQSACGAPPADLFGYDELMRSFAVKISLGIAAPIACVGLAICFFAMGDPSGVSLKVLPENIAAALGILCVFIGTAICLGLIIPAAMRHAAFVKAHPYLEDFYTEEEKAAARTRFTAELVCGILSICLGICSGIVLADTPLEFLGALLLLLFIAVGVCLIVHGGLTLSRVEIENYNQEAGEHLTRSDIDAAKLSDEQREALLSKQASGRRRGAICGMIMIIATIVALVMLFVFENPIFWMCWVVGGLLCGITSLAFKAAGKE